MPTTRMCRECGRELSAGTTNAVCSSCRYKARPARTRTCTECGREWTSKATGLRCDACKRERRKPECAGGCGKRIDPRSTYCNQCKPTPQAVIDANRSRAVDARGPRASAVQVVERALSSAQATPDGCLLVTEWRPQARGYVRGPRVDDRGPQMLHRLVVEVATGVRLDPEVSVDHLCHNAAAEAGRCVGGEDCVHRRCANINHLDVVDPVTNWARGTRGGVPKGVTVGQAALNAAKTHCVHGHPLSGKNLYIDGRGRRQCRACRRARVAGRDPKVEPTYLA